MIDTIGAAMPPEHLLNLINADAEDIDWNAVIERVESHPDEVQFLRRTSPLLRILELDPSAEAARTFIRTYPQSVNPYYNGKDGFFKR